MITFLLFSAVHQLKNHTIFVSKYYIKDVYTTFYFFLQQIGKPLECCTSEKSFSLGKGCNGTSVYVGIMEDGIEVAVKRMLTQACEDSARNEIEILTRTDTKESPYIVSYRDFHQDDTFMYLILDLCEETLKEHVHVQTAEYLRRHGPRMVKEMLTGLEFLHSQGILHRDLKPSNVLVDVAGHMRLADFGLSRVLGEDETTVQTDAIGTQDWMPVEVVEARNKRQKCRFKKKSDVQAVGMMAFFILTRGDHPFGSSSVECMTNILKGQPINLDKLVNFRARQFVEWLISHYITDRPYANEALRHSFMDQVEEIQILPKLLIKRQEEDDESS